MIAIQIVGGTQLRSSEPALTIGSDAGSAIAFPGDARLQPRHAVIRHVAGRWLIESTGEGQFQIGGGVPTRMAWLQAGDCIRLSRSGPDLIFSPVESSVSPAPAGAPAVAPPGAPAEAPRHDPPFRRQRPDDEPIRRPADAVPPGEPNVVRPPAPGTHPAAGERPDFRPARSSSTVWSLTGAGLLLLGLALGIILPQFGSRPPAGPDRKSPESDLAAIGPNPSATSGTSAGEVRATGAASTGPERALGLIVVKSTVGDLTNQAGTGFSIGGRRLVTTAVVAQDLQNLMNNSFTGAVRATAAHQEVAIVSVEIHPEFRSARAQEPEALDEYDAICDELETLEQSDPIGPDEQARQGTRLKELIERLARSEQRLEGIYEQIAACDVAVLHLADEFPGMLEPADAGSRLATGTALPVWGCPIVPDDLLIGPDQFATAAHTMAKVVTYSQPAKGSASPSRLLVQIPSTDVEGKNWSGSPVLDPAGRVIGIYSRPTPVEKSADATPKVKTHNVVEVSKLKELLQRLGQ